MAGGSLDQTLAGWQAVALSGGLSLYTLEALSVYYECMARTQYLIQFEFAILINPNNGGGAAAGGGGVGGCGGRDTMQHRYI